MVLRRPKGWERNAPEDVDFRHAARYFEERGSNVDAFLQTGGVVVADASRIHPAYGNRAAMVWNFFDPQGKQFTYQENGRSHPFNCVRFLDTATSADHDKRFMQPPNSGTHVFFVRHPNICWPNILADATCELIISEGPSRALAAALRDLALIALTGVNCGQVKGKLHPDLAGIQWRGRRVYLAFDSDSSQNGAVQSALEQLAVLLTAEGANIYQIRIPASSKGQKQGLDDYLSRHSL